MTEETEERPKFVFPNREQRREMRETFMSIDGQDPELQQTTSRFLKFDNDIERSNLMNMNAVLAMTQADICDNDLYPNDPENPFAWLKRGFGSSSMAFKGWKSDGFVEMMKKGFDLAGLQTKPEELQQRSFFDRFRRNTEE